jgi:hypothetical protein
MTKTGQKFDINPETFTLANVFSMELHRYQDTIAEIVWIEICILFTFKIRLPSMWKYTEVICK